MKDHFVEPSRELSDTATSLLRNAVLSDNSAWEKLVKRYSRRIHDQCLRAGLQFVDADEVMQEVFLKVSKNLHTFRKDSEGQSFRGWLCVVTLNCIRDWQRKQQRRVQVDPTGGSDSLELLHQLPAYEPSSLSSQFQVPGTLHSQAVALVQAKTSPWHWELFTLLNCQEITPQELAERFNINRSQVYVIKSRINAEIRKQHEELLRSSSSPTSDPGESAS
jgi:RNA polymerase sigma-70 factor, ECF subfamily